MTKNLPELEQLAANMQSEINQLDEIIADAQAKKGKLINQIKPLRKKISVMQKGSAGISVSDHAVIRYLERVCGVDVEVYRDTIRKSVITSGLPVGEAKYPIKGGGKAVLHDNAIVTVTV